MNYLESRLRDIFPPGASDDDVRLQLERIIMSAQEMPKDPLLMLARLLSFNAGLVDQKWAANQQWNTFEGAGQETRISFFVPCLRPRFK